MARLLRKVESSNCATEMDGELVMIHVDTGKFFSLKGVGLDIWQRLDAQSDLDAICDELCRDYGISADECSKAVDTFVSQLTAAGFAELA
ncbi:PqqD family protein [Novosphingobium jiangmenense]|uniref:PqqD family protein n=1 Tax=Novosphingobium jiangmenense TaxID=2791981 RepID=A0ABS0HL99_9SPHN|nr:PqqD family protein [Novosphingobium jiangmenense]MBF9153026.1 PqqD family protein [Novosphingobium jiangmenense]